MRLIASNVPLPFLQTSSKISNPWWMNGLPNNFVVKNSYSHYWAIYSMFTNVSDWLSEYNGTSYFDHTIVKHIFELDACLMGMGGRWGNMVYHLAVPSHFQNLAIVHLEMVNLLVAVRIFAKFWHRHSVLVRCDNSAVVQILNSGKTKDPFLVSSVLHTSEVDLLVLSNHNLSACFLQLSLLYVRVA